jgi:hypothetical protein
MPPGQRYGSVRFRILRPDHSNPAKEIKRFIRLMSTVKLIRYELGRLEG